MTMGFCLNLQTSGDQIESPVVVNQTRDLLLFHDSDLLGWEAEIVIFVKQFHGKFVGVSTGHDGERY